MTIWQQSLANANCVEQIQECLAILASANTERFAVEHLASLARLTRVLKVLEARLSTIDAELFPVGTWSSFGGWLGSAKNHLQQFNQSKNPGLLQQANDQIDNILGILKPLDVKLSPELVKATSEAVAIFQARIVEELERVRAKSIEIKAQVDGLTKDVAQGKARIEENNRIIEQQKGRLDQSITDFQKQFSQSESNRSLEHTTALRRMADDLATQTKSQDAKFTESAVALKARCDVVIQEIQRKGDEHLKFFKKRETEVNEIFGAIGAASLSGHFKNTADRDAVAANRFRLTALGLMTAMVLVGGFTFVHSLTHPTLDWKLFAFRLATTIIIVIPAIYAAQESAKHRERERQNRKLHLELASIDAYLVLLPEPKRNELKEKLTEKFFGRPDAIEKSDDVTKHALFELLSSVLKNLTRPKP